MKLLSLCAILCMVTPVSVGEVALTVDRVQRVEAVCFMDEWYVALISEPIYLRSEGEKLSKEVKDKIKQRLGVDCYVTIDVGLYYAIKEAKASDTRYQKLLKISEIFKDRCLNERHINYQSQETGIST